ncbi:unnamed protein product, partial [Iphiclides podalirius]
MDWPGSVPVRAAARALYAVSAFCALYGDHSLRANTASLLRVIRSHITLVGHQIKCQFRGRKTNETREEWWSAITLRCQASRLLIPEGIIIVLHSCTGIKTKGQRRAPRAVALQTRPKSDDSHSPQTKSHE